MMLLLILFVLALGIFLIYIAWKTSEKKCPPPRVEYRFIPRTLKEQLENPVKVSEIFSSMFDDPNLFLYRNMGTEISKSDMDSQNFISQS